MADSTTPSPEDLAKAYEAGREGEGIIDETINDLIYSDEEKEARERGTEDRINAKITRKESEEDDD